MRILHLAKFYPPDPGGIEHVVAALAEGAAERGHQVRVVCAAGSSWEGIRGTGKAERRRRGVEVVRLPTHGVVWSQPIAPGYLSAARWPADIVYVHHPHPLADQAVLLSPKRSTLVLHHSDVQRQRLILPLYRPLCHCAVRRAEATIVATNANLDYAKDLGVNGRRKARIIPFGTNASVYVPRSSSPRPAVFPPDRAGPVGLFVGRLVPYKGLDVLLNALVGTALHVVIVGDGPLRIPLRRLADALCVSNQVRFIGAVGGRSLPEFYQAADYFVLPSVSTAEMFGISMLEAMACARPLISTDLPTGVREVNEAGVTGLRVPPGDVQALRAAMMRLAEDPEFRATLGAAGRRRVEERFTLERMIDAHMGLCEEVAGNGA